MRILVTGGAGFIASHIADAYVKAGHKVAVVDNLSRGKLEQVNKRARFFKADIRDKARLEKLFKAFKPVIVNHHAAQIDLRKSVADPAMDAGVNILGSINVLELSLKYKVKKIIFASTGGALYGEQDYFPADENHPIRPLSPYGIAKRSVELYLFYYQAVHGLKYVSLRYSNVYGPRQDPHGEAGVVAIFAEKLWKKIPPTINGTGKQTRDYVCVGDVVAANLMALKQNAAGPFNIGTGKETNVNQIFTHLNQIIGAKVKAVHGPAKKGEQMRSMLDNRKARKVLGWKPTMDLDCGLQLTAEFFKPDMSVQGKGR
jgi:UDP-glucose 4-epimerase